ncbi:2-dehydropantoate 2-reductase [Xylaria sp. CBS 124048]|nr:2-dehydropantoate 2-reductase [Xylaria sp. CBS 124048]
MPPRILIFGTGSLGITYGWVLSRAVPESNITAVCRSNYDIAMKEGFVLNSTIWGNDHHMRPRVVRSVSEAITQSQEPFDYILVTTKVLPSTASTPELIRPAITPGKTAVVLVQNGIRIEDEYARLYTGDDVPILSTVAYLTAHRTAPNVASHEMLEHLHVGTYPAAGVPATHKLAAQAFVDLIKSGGATAILHDDIQAQRWDKAVINGSWNPICALTRLRDKEFLDFGQGKAKQGGKDEHGRLIRDVMLEIASVAQACGYKNVNEKAVDFILERTVRFTSPGIKPSMLVDAIEERSLEIDAIVGNVVKTADEKDVPVPLLRTVYLLAQGLSGSFSLAK